MVEVIELAPGAWAAALFENVSPYSGPVWQFARQSLGRTQTEALARLGIPLTMTVVTQLGRSSVVWPYV